MSVNNPNFPTSQGERQIDDTKIQKAVTIGSTTVLPSSLSSASVYQIPKTLTRQIVPSQNTQMIAISKPVTAPQALQKKDLQKASHGFTSIGSVTTLQSGVALSNVIPVQINSMALASATGSALHAANLSNLVQVHHPTAFSHLPRGVVAATGHVRSGAAVAVPQQAMQTSVPTAAFSLQNQICNVLPQTIHPCTTPAPNRPVTPVSLAGSQMTETHRANVPLHNVTTVGNTPSIQITLQASRVQGELPAKGTALYQPGKQVHLNQPLNMTCPPKVIMTHAMAPVFQHQTLAAKGNRCQPVSQPALSVTVALSTTTVTIPVIASATSSTTIPIAKVPPQRQPQTGSLLGTAMSATTLDHRTETSFYPQPLPAHAQSASSIQVHTPLSTLQAHSQACNSLYVPQYRGTPLMITSVSSSVNHTEMREASLSSMPPFLPPLMSSPDNPYYHHLMQYQVAAVAQGRQQGLLPSQPMANIAGLSPAVTEVTAVSNIRFSQPLMVFPHTRQGTPQTQMQTVSSQLHSSCTVSDGIGKVLTSTVPMIATALSAAAMPQASSNIHTAASQIQHTSQSGQLAHSATSATPVTNANASPRPSILRKRPLNEGSAVKKQLLTSMEVYSPRPDPRLDSTPHSNMSSPKTPASGALKSDTLTMGPRKSPISESQSSTDTALSSEATTPTLAHSDSRVKQESQENGFGSCTPEASPRKRRKQLLQANEEIPDTPVSGSVFDRLVEACVKEEITEEEDEMEDEEEDDDFDDDDMLSEDEKPEDSREEYVDEDGIRWTLEKCRPNIAPLNFYNISWKPRNNHFVRYTDVKPKDERRPTVNEMSNQKGVLQKTSGWKLYHIAAQIEDLVELESELNNKLLGLQAAMGPDPPLQHSLMEDESSVIHELTQGNIQRCCLITDQLNEAKSQMLHMLDHKPKIAEIISKHISKRPIKRKERT